MHLALIKFFVLDQVRASRTAMIRIDRRAACSRIAFEGWILALLTRHDDTSPSVVKRATVRRGHKEEMRLDVARQVAGQTNWRAQCSQLTLLA